MFSYVSRSFRTSPLLARLINFNIPQPAEGLIEVEIQQWHKKVGDTIAREDVLVEASCDKKNITYKSDYDGVLTEIHFDSGEFAPVDGALYTIEVSDDTPVKAGEKLATGKPAAKKEAAAPEPVKSSEEKYGKRILTSPAVKVLAKSKGIDLSKVTGTQKGGRITKEDLLNYIAGKPAEGPTPVSLENYTQPPEEPHAPPMAPPLMASTKDQVINLNAQQRGMFKTMTAAASIPHLTYMDEVFIDQLMELKKEMDKSGVKLTYMPFFIKALSLALLEYPIFNSAFTNDFKSYITYGSHNISIAMDTPYGLFVPNIKDVQNKSVLQIATDVTNLIATAQAGKLNEELDGGTITLSNVGMIGGTYVRPVIMPPQVAIGGLTKIKKVLERDEDGEIVDKHQFCVSFSTDHRICDGATTARFVSAFKKYVESPGQMLLNLR